MQWQREVIEPYRARHDAWLNLDVGTPLSSIELRLNTDELAFLLQNEPEVWQKAMLEDYRFNLAKRHIEHREEVVLKQAWPRMAEAGILVGTQMNEAEMERILGAAIVQQLRRRTEGIIAIIDENVETSFAAFSAFDLRMSRRRIG